MDDVVMIGDLGPAAPVASDAVTIDEAANENPLPKCAQLLEDGSVRLPLLRPVSLRWQKMGGGPVTEDTFTELTMKRLTGKDMTAIQEASRGQTSLVAIARSAGIAAPKFKHIFERMDGADVINAGAVVSYFLNNGLTTGQ